MIVLAEFVPFNYMLDIKNAIDKQSGKYIFKCKKCPKLIKSKSYYLEKHSGLCRSCVMKKPPFFHTYTRFKNTAKYEGHSNTLNFEDFLKFTEIKNCHYCNTKILWMEYQYHNNQYTRGGYFLDRKNNNLGYSIENCVVSCTKCNKAKSDKYTYEEWWGMTKYFRDKV